MSDRCDQKVFDKGSAIFMTDSIPAEAVEKFVTAVREDSKQRVDWHYAGGRAVVLYLGKQDKVVASLKKLRHLHDSAYESMMRESNKTTKCQDTNGNTVPMYSDDQINRAINSRWEHAAATWWDQPKPKRGWTGKVHIVMPTYENLEPKYQQWFKDTIFFAEATSQEYHAIWQEYRYEQINPCFVIEVGKVGKHSVCAEFRFVRIDGELICLYDGTSRVVDFVMIEDWIRKTFDPKWDKGTRFAHCDSQNFHHAINAIEDKTGRKVKRYHYCHHPDCYSKRHHDLSV